MPKQRYGPGAEQEPPPSDSPAAKLAPSTRLAIWLVAAVAVPLWMLAIFGVWNRVEVERAKQARIDSLADDLCGSILTESGFSCHLRFEGEDWTPHPVEVWVSKADD